MTHLPRSRACLKIPNLFSLGLCIFLAVTRSSSRRSSKAACCSSRFFWACWSHAACSASRLASTSACCCCKSCIATASTRSLSALAA
ncbi:hypothetical protein PF005_g31684 [Phytophthora fragariae]|uniref:Secreted protein n=1 Tax=Phytophthora fragariae TaxID=53985 RepID=A0A6A4BGJ6_9STRA|nr:hypothetical protein PF003_g27389 [Phytophthora fragariae]KAE8922149.1 hypothetical protein PF009_g27581 [Phytophthora fragariae]KAE9062088.1 hypothetical protein PF007_g30040 [Phytophthora fragariae]KAE9064905.1 hypothetical protein PF010_g28431 [Phytophthora fragariae]KAE9068532.1 hypothetical protein PF006_g29771 [Phytophthora fragariae]